jgi:hypothetical protein
MDSIGDRRTKHAYSAELGQGSNHPASYSVGSGASSGRDRTDQIDAGRRRKRINSERSFSGHDRNPELAGEDRREDKSDLPTVIISTDSGAIKMSGLWLLRTGSVTCAAKDVFACNIGVVRDRSQPSRCACGLLLTGMSVEGTACYPQLAAPGVRGPKPVQ